MQKRIGELTKVAIIQARMSSERLPGKVLKEVNEKPLLLHQLERVARSKHVEKIVVATSTNPADDEIEKFAKKGNISLFRGSEGDVLSRFEGAAQETGATTIIRLTADCPLSDPEVIDHVITKYLEQPNACKFATNAIPRSYPAGLEVECFSREALEIASLEAKEDYDREHVTPFFYRNPNRFFPLSVVSTINYSKERWTLDEQSDFYLIKKIMEALSQIKADFKMVDVLNILDANPDWRKLNSAVQETPRLVKDNIFKGADSG